MPKSWLEFQIDWKLSWDETLAVNGNEKLWKQVVGKNPALQPSADRIQKFRHIWLLEQMIGHFPKELDKCAAACRHIANTYASLGDRTRAAYWFKRLAEDYAERPDRAEAYADILRLADTDAGLLAADDWVAYALNGINAMIKSAALPADHVTAVLARQRGYALLLAHRNHIGARRWLDQLDAETKDPQLQLERASLLKAAGHRAAAADLYDAAGDQTKAEGLRAVIQQAQIEGVGKPMPRNLEIRWNAIETKRKGNKSIIEDPGLVQQTLKLAAEFKSFWQATPSHRVQCWMAVDEALRKLPPAEMEPFRQFQETEVVPVLEQLGQVVDANVADQLFRNFPWSASVHSILRESGEMSLRANRPDEAFRAFQNVLAHSDDPKILGQARVGAWFAMTELGEPGEALEEAMGTVGDDAKLSWRGREMPASDVKRIMRKLLPPGTVGLPTAGKLPRLRIELPAALAADTPASEAPNAAPQGLGALAVRRIEQYEGGLYFFGPRHVACYDAKTSALSWFQVGNSLLDGPDGQAFPSTEAHWPKGMWRPAGLGSPRSTAISQRRSPHPGEAVAPSAAYNLLFNNLHEATQCEVAAFDARSGQVLWRTLARDELRDLEPLSEPAATEGRVYFVAQSNRFDRPLTVLLVCLDGETGASVWQQPLGNVPPQTREQKRSLLSSAVTLYRSSVYVSTNMGILARCDARDGTIEWVRTYAGVDQGPQSLEQVRREGTSPLVVGDRVFAAPRDHSGVMAIDRTAGYLLWDMPLVPSSQIVGASGTTLIVRGGDELAALDLASGKELWARSVGESGGARAILAGPDVFMIMADKLLRVAAASGDVVEELPLERGPGSAHALLADGTLVQVSIAPTVVAGPKLVHAPKPQLLPLTEDWKLPCPNSRLVLPPGESGPPNIFGILSERRFVCVSTKPQARIAWQTVLRDGADSVGFHGNLVLVARGTMLTALEAVGGATRWSLRLPFEPQVVGGDGRALFAGELSRSAKVISIDPSSGQIHWYRGFGEEAAIGDGPLGWIAMRTDSSGPPALILYWHKALLGKEGWRPGEMIVDAVSGTIQELRPFLPKEPAWPEHMVFGDSTRTYVGNPPFSLRAYQSSFRRDVIALAGDRNLAHIVRNENSTDLATGWNRSVDLAGQNRYEGAIGLFSTASGLYVKQSQELFHFDAADKREVALKIPVPAEMLNERTVMDLREQGDAVAIISQEPGQPVRSGSGTISGLKDNTGKGNVTIQWLGPGAQVGHFRTRFPETGISPVSTLLDGSTREHYKDQTITMNGLSSLGWEKYNVFLYGLPGAKTTINDKDPQVCASYDFKNPQHRTTFIRGVNYVKFEAVRGDSFTLKAPNAFSAIQVADASGKTAPGGNVASLGVNWTGGGPAHCTVGDEPGPNDHPEAQPREGAELGPNDRVGAEVPMAPWYNINKYHSLTGGYQNHQLFVDVFDRKTGALRQSQKIPIGPRDPRIPNHKREAAILDGAVVVTDVANVYVLRSSAP